MDQLIVDIDGDRNGGIGPARGGSKLKKLQDLSRSFWEVRAADRERDTVLAKFAQLYYTICAANLHLKRVLGKSHKSWVPPAQQPKRRGPLFHEWPLCYSEIVHAAELRKRKA
jgi:hypothetical protein